MSVTIVGGMDLEKLHLAAEDILIVRGGLEPRQLVAIRDHVKRIYGFEILVLQLADGMTLETLPREAALRVLRAIAGGAVLPPGLRPPPLPPAALGVALGLLSQAVDDWNDADVDIDIEADRAGLEEPPPRPEPKWVTQAEVLLRAAGLRP